MILSEEQILIRDTARAFARIAGTKTLTLATIREAQKLGYRIEQAREEFAI